jgi:hypothetical protein
LRFEYYVITTAIIQFFIYVLTELNREDNPRRKQSDKKQLNPLRSSSFKLKFTNGAGDLQTTLIAEANLAERQ